MKDTLKHYQIIPTNNYIQTQREEVTRPSSFSLNRKLHTSVTVETRKNFFPNSFSFSNSSSKWVLKKKKKTEKNLKKVFSAYCKNEFSYCKNLREFFHSNRKHRFVGKTEFDEESFTKKKVKRVFSQKIYPIQFSKPLYNHLKVWNNYLKQKGEI